MIDTPRTLEMVYLLKQLPLNTYINPQSRIMRESF